MNEENYISIEKCVHGGLYHIDARSFYLGIYDEKKKGFVGVRSKFGKKYLFIEFHWDTGFPYGTVKPFKFLELCPLEDIDIHHSFVDKNGCNCSKDNKDLREWLDEKIKKYKKNKLLKIRKKEINDKNKYENEYENIYKNEYVNKNANKYVKTTVKKNAKTKEKTDKERIELFKSLRKKLKDEKKLNLTKDEYVLLKQCMKDGAKKIVDMIGKMR